MMVSANIAELKDRLSEFISRVEAGDRVTVCRRNIPVAKIEPIVWGGDEAGGLVAERPRILGGVVGWLEDDDLFFAAINAARDRGGDLGDPFAG